MDTDAYVLSVALAGGALGIAHFALSPEITGYRLSRLSAYGLGVGVIALTTTGLGLLYARTPADVLALLWCAIVAAGAATVGGRLFRAWFDGLHARRERDELLRKTRGAP